MPSNSFFFPFLICWNSGFFSTCCANFTTGDSFRHQVAIARIQTFSNQPDIDSVFKIKCRTQNWFSQPWLSQLVAQFVLRTSFVLSVPLNNRVCFHRLLQWVPLWSRSGWLMQVCVRARVHPNQKVSEVFRGFSVISRLSLWLGVKQHKQEEADGVIRWRKECLSIYMCVCVRACSCVPCVCAYRPEDSLLCVNLSNYLKTFFLFSFFWNSFLFSINNNDLLIT